VKNGEDPKPQKKKKKMFGELGQWTSWNIVGWPGIEEKRSNHLGRGAGGGGREGEGGTETTKGKKKNTIPFDRATAGPTSFSKAVSGNTEKQGRQSQVSTVVERKEKITMIAGPRRRSHTAWFGSQKNPNKLGGFLHSEEKPEKKRGGKTRPRDKEMSPRVFGR